MEKGIKFVWGDGVGPQIGEIQFTELVVCQQIDGMHFTDGGRIFADWWNIFYRWWKTFADCFMRVLACEEDEDENSPLIATRWFVFRRSKGINRI